MKTRNGFVSNSSSSSFVFIGFPAMNVTPGISFKNEVLSKVDKRIIDKFAISEIEDDAEYETYKKTGNAPDNFWKKAYVHFKDLVYTNVPEGYEEFDINGISWWGIVISRVYGTGEDTTDFIEMFNTFNKIKLDYPDISPKVVLCSEGC